MSESHERQNHALILVRGMEHIKLQLVPLIKNKTYFEKITANYVKHPDGKYLNQNTNYGAI